MKTAITFYAFCFLIIIAISILSCNNGTDVDDMCVVVCHYAKVDEVTGAHSDIHLTEQVIPKDDLGKFIKAAIKANEKLEPDTILHSGVPRSIVRIRAADAILRENIDNPETQELVGQDWKVYWTASGYPDEGTF